MAFMQAFGNCVVCHRMFAFNPERVPSVRVNGSREPVCRTCIERANPLRVAKGLPAIEILPNAYGAEEVA